MKKSTIFMALGMVAVVAAALVGGYFLGKRSGGEKPKGPRYKVMMLGVDGADWAVIDSLLDQGKLPTFKKLIEEGASGPLESIAPDPLLSPIIWTTIATGKSQEKHGITYFLVQDPQHSHALPVQSTMRQVKAIWNIASDNGLTSGTIGWWASFPAEKVNGFVVSDYMAFHAFNLTGDAVKEDVGKTWPPELIKEISAYFKDPLTIPKKELDFFMPLTDEEYKYSVSQPFEFGNPLDHFMFTLATGEAYHDIGLKLYKEFDPGLMMVYFEQVDTVSHVFMRYAPPKMEGMEDKYYEKYKNVVSRYYEKQDAILADFVAAADKDTVIMIMSDHGFKTGDKRLTETEGTKVATAHLWHEPFGVVILWGGPVKKGVRVQGARVFDITPTALYLLGLPIGRDMDGKVIADALDEKFMREDPPRYIDSYESGGRAVASSSPTGTASEVDSQVLKQLEALGYISGSGDVDDSIVRQNRIQAHLKAGNVDAALKEVDAILAGKPDDIVATMIKAQILEQKGNQAEAVELYKKIAARGDTDFKDKEKRPAAEALKSLGSIEHLSGNTDEGIKLLLRSIGLYPDDPEAHYNLGVMYEAKGDLPGATEQYRKAIELKPDLALAHNNLGNCLQKQGKVDEAIAEYKKTAEIDPKHLESRYNLGVVLRSQGKRAEAIEAFKAALAINPSFAQAAIALSDLYLEDGKPAEAVAVLQALADKTPGDPRPLYFLARAHVRAGDKQKARAAIDKARAIDPAGVEASMKQDELLKEFLK